MRSLSFLFLSVFCAFLIVTSCYDDSSLRSDVTDLKNRVISLEEKVFAINGYVSTLQGIVEALNGKVYVNSVMEVSDGWIITFSNGNTATIRNGIDGHTPIIGVKEDSNGLYYWTLDGEWLYDQKNGKILVTGIAPQLEIKDGYWYISTDGGVEWTMLGKATGDQGKDGYSFFQSISWDNTYYYFVLVDGTVLKISRPSFARIITVVPDYSDGAVRAEGDTFTIRFDVYPKEAAASLAAINIDCFELKVVFTTLTKAAVGDSTTLPIISKEAKGETLYLIVDGTVLPAEYLNGSLGANASLSIVTDETVMTSGYFPLKHITYFAVDLGLSVYWGTCNIGASKPGESGDFYAWGETEPKTDYSWYSYKWGRSSHSLTRYNSYSDFGTVDYKTSFEDYNYEDDVARQIIGEKWRTPTKEEMDELELNCDSQWTVMNGIYGKKFISKISGYTDRWIFLPASGYRTGITLKSAGYCGFYWSSSLNEGFSPYHAYNLVFGSYDYGNSESYVYFGDNRQLGFMVRPVREK